MGTALRGSTGGSTVRELGWTGPLCKSETLQWPFGNPDRCRPTVLVTGRGGGRFGDRRVEVGVYMTSNDVPLARAVGQCTGHLSPCHDDPPSFFTMDLGPLVQSTTSGVPDKDGRLIRSTVPPRIPVPPGVNRIENRTVLGWTLSVPVGCTGVGVDYEETLTQERRTLTFDGIVHNPSSRRGPGGGSGPDVEVSVQTSGRRGSRLGPRHR